MGRQEVRKSRPGPWRWSEALPEYVGLLLQCCEQEVSWDLGGPGKHGWD